jgi:hypothetical protein
MINEMGEDSPLQSLSVSSSWLLIDIPSDVSSSSALTEFRVKDEDLFYKLQRDYSFSNLLSYDEESPSSPI